MGKAVFTPRQNAFRFYEDGTESGSTPIGAEDTEIISDADSVDQNLHLRILIQESGGADGVATDDWQLQYSYKGGAYTNVTSSSSVVKGFNSGNLTDGDPTTNRGTNGISDGTGSFSAGEISEDGLIDDMQLTLNDFTEILYSLTLVSADLSYTDTIEFRVLINGGLMLYNVTPKITVAFGVATYYFDGSDSVASDPDGAWTNETNMDDGDVDTDAIANVNGTETTNYVQIEGTNAPVSGNDITEVFLRYHDGTNYGSYSAALTAPAGGWTWPILQALEIRVIRILPLPGGTFRFFVYEDGNAGGTELDEINRQNNTNIVSIIELQVFLGEVVAGITSKRLKIGHGA